MAGGKRPGAGRPKGSRNKVTAKREAEVAQSGLTPLAYMLKVMRDTKVDKARRDEMAKASAPYVHPRLNAVDHGAAINELSDTLNRLLSGATREGNAVADLVKRRANAG